MQKYTKDDYTNDLKNPKMLHIKDKERFKAFYTFLGNEPIQKQQQIVPSRINFIRPKGNIIELGCHAGFQCIFWGQQGFNCIGVDISQPLIDEANVRVSTSKDIKGQVKFICSDILDLDINKLGKFDTIVLTETLEHVMDPDTIFEKAVEFMENDSLLYIAAPSTRVGTYSHVRGITEDYIKKMANQFNLLVRFNSTKSDTRAILIKKYY